MGCAAHCSHLERLYQNMSPIRIIALMIDDEEHSLEILSDGPCIQYNEEISPCTLAKKRLEVTRSGYKQRFKDC